MVLREYTIIFLHFLVRAAKTCSCVNYSTMISLIVISFMRSVPSLMFIIQPLLERAIVSFISVIGQIMPSFQRIKFFFFFLLDIIEF